MCHNVTNVPKDKIFLERRPKVKVTVIQKQCLTLCKPKMYPHTKFENPRRYAPDTIFLELRPGQGRKNSTDTP